MGIRTIDLKVDDFIGKLKDQISLGSADENTVRRLMRLFEIFLEGNLRGEKALFDRFGMPDNLFDVTREPEFQDFIRKSFGESLYEKSLKLMEIEARLYDMTMGKYSDIKWGNRVAIGQMEYIYESPEKRMLIEAGPGAGKTWALVQKLLYMTDPGNKNPIPPGKVLVLTFSRAAAAVIRSRLQKEAEKNYPDSPYDNIQIATIDSFAYSLLRVMSQSNVFNEYVKGFAENYENKTRRDYDWYINEALQALRVSSCDNLNVMKTAGYRFVAVDEVQDINGIRADFILELLNQLPPTSGISALGDPCQAIYDFSLDERGLDSQTTAVQFFEGLKEIKGMNQYCFTGNHRSNLSMNSNLNEYRPFFTCADLADTTKALISEFQEPIKKVSLDELPDSIRWVEKLSEAAGEKSTIAVLVRSNDQALMLFDYLHDKRIPVFWQRRREIDNYLAGWIGYFFREYKEEYIGKGLFFKEFNRIFQSERARILLRAGGNDPGKYWEALEGCLDIDEAKEKYPVEKMLRDLYHNAYYVKEDYRILFSGMVPDERVILSTVHQAKGREYDYVFLLEDLLSPYVSNKALNRNEKLNEECRIAYVGMTRPMKGIVQIGKTYPNWPDKLRTIQKNNPNYHLSRLNKLGSVSGTNIAKKIEVGYDEDFTPESFAHSRYVQDCIHKLIPIGQPLILKQIYREHYELILKNREDEIHLAENSLTFHDDLGMLVNHKYCNKEWPDQFSQIYANDMITFISLGDVGEGARKFGKLSIWNGIDAVGVGTAY